jgi:hypothetical protein
MRECHSTYADIRPDDLSGLNVQPAHAENTKL